MDQPMRSRVEGEEPIPAGNYAQALFETAGRHPDRIAIVSADGALSYGELADRALEIAQATTAAGVEPGDRVAVLLPRGGEAAAAFFGLLAAGAVAVIVNESLKHRQVEHIVDHAGARMLLSEPDMVGRLGAPPPAGVEAIDVATVAGPGAAGPTPRADNDVAQIIYTSGSTGLPKGVTLSHGNLWAGTGAVLEYLRISKADRIASLLPFSFDYGLNQLLCAVRSGAALVVERSPVPQRIARTLRDEQVTVLPAVPPLWLQLLTVDSFRQDPIPSLRAMTNTGGRLPVEAVRALRGAQPQAELFLMYGLTEAFRSAFLDPEQVDRKPTSVGRAIPGAELLVVREDLSPCEPGEEGELVHRGPTVGLGYWKDPDLTDSVFRPDPFEPTSGRHDGRVVFSGDVVFRDQEGDLFVVGRRDNMIKSLGYRVSPDEVTEILHASGEVVEAVVTSEPDPRLGSRIIAYVVLADSGQVDRLTRFCAAEMPRYMRPARIETRTSLDRTPSGKFDVAAIVATGEAS